MGKQQGFTMVFTLIVLLIMTLAGVSLTRSVDTAGVIMGNLAFTQSAIRSTDCGIETAITWLQSRGNSNLYNSDLANGYVAIREDPNSAQSWGDFWANLELSNKVITIPSTTTCKNFKYIIQRLCNATGDPNLSSTKCSVPPATSASGNSKGSAAVAPSNFSNQVYYRITVRVDGTRGTVSYVQVIIAM